MRSASIMRRCTQNYLRLLKKSKNVDRWLEYLFDAYIHPAAMDGCIGCTVELPLKDRKVIQELIEKLRNVYFYQVGLIGETIYGAEIEISWEEAEEMEDQG